MEMKISFSVKGQERRKLAQTVGEVLKTVPVYRGVPSCAYEIGDCVLDRQGTLLIGKSLDSEAVIWAIFLGHYPFKSHTFLSCVWCKGCF